ncbi:MAG: DUF167 domain-containing protein [Acidobacteria bacterium]|nr:DUF167 domain-containing protein [Acidobacteriota bacterium]
MAITDTADGVVIDVRVTPRSSRSGLMGLRDGVLLLRLHAPPVEGAANTEVVKLVATLLGVPKSAVTIATGHRNRLKRVRVQGVSANSVRATLGIGGEGAAPPAA